MNGLSWTALLDTPQTAYPNGGDRQSAAQDRVGRGRFVSRHPIYAGRRETPAFQRGDDRLRHEQRSTFPPDVFNHSVVVLPIDSIRPPTTRTVPGFVGPPHPLRVRVEGGNRLSDRSGRRGVTWNPARGQSLAGDPAEAVVGRALYRKPPIYADTRPRFRDVPSPATDIFSLSDDTSSPLFPTTRRLPCLGDGDTGRRSGRSRSRRPSRPANTRTSLR